MMNRKSVIGALTIAFLTIGYADLRAETFFLNDGEVFDGAVMRSVGKTLSIKLPGLGMRQLPINTIDRVEVTLGSGEAIAGKLVNWSKNVYDLEVGDRRLSVRDGQVVTDVAVDADMTAVSAEPQAVEGIGGPEVSLATPEALDAKQEISTSTEF